jgi:hypothetical protein
MDGPLLDCVSGVAGNPSYGNPWPLSPEAFSLFREASGQHTVLYTQFSQTVDFYHDCTAWGKTNIWPYQILY